MPKASCANPVFLDALQKWRDEIIEKNPDDNRAKVLTKAITSLRACKTVLATPEDLAGLKFVGKWVANGVRSRCAADLGSDGPDEVYASSSKRPKRKSPDADPSGSSPPPPKKRGRPKKQDELNDGRKASSSRGAVVSIPHAIPRSSSATVAPLPGWDPYVPQDSKASQKPKPSQTTRDASTAVSSNPMQIFQFWYIDSQLTRVPHRDQASVDVLEDNQIYHSVEFSATQKSHALVGCFQDVRPGRSASTLYAWMPWSEVRTRKFSNAPIQSGSSTASASSTGLRLAESGSQSKKPSLVQELKTEAALRTKTIDPSRQMSQLPQIDRFKSSASTSLDSTKSPKSIVASSYVTRTKSTPNVIPSKKLSENPVPPRHTSTAIGRTMSVPAGELMRPPPAPILITTAKTRKAPRLSSQIPPPPAIDQVLEHHLDRAAGIGSDERAMDPDTDPNSPFSLPFTPIIFPPGSYTICLILDSREIESSKNRQYVQKQLSQRGVLVETRALVLGDVCWVAKRNDGSAEAVLDFIMERKRIDDLVSSIKDSRFHEQKFRLQQSGIGRVYYLVEEYQRNDQPYAHKSMDQAIFTAMSSTQIVEGFFLKETRDIDDTIEYLVGLHQTIQALHEGQVLNVIPPNEIKRHSYFALQSQLRKAFPSKTFLTSFASFQTLNKAGSVTLRDFFARMLLCINGMSAEKTAAIIEVYDTPMSLWNAFKEAERREARARALEAELEAVTAATAKPKGRRKKSSIVPARLMLAQLGGSGRRKIGDALAGKVYDLFRAESY